MFRQNYWKISIQIHFDCVEQENWTMILKKKNPILKEERDVTTKNWKGLYPIDWFSVINQLIP